MSQSQDQLPVVLNPRKISNYHVDFFQGRIINGFLTIAYGIGFLQGPGLRSRVHTEIAENTKKRIRREKRERRLRRQSSGRSGPQQLN